MQAMDLISLWPTSCPDRKYNGYGFIILLYHICYTSISFYFTVSEEFGEILTTFTGGGG